MRGRQAKLRHIWCTLIKASIVMKTPLLRSCQRQARFVMLVACCCRQSPLKLCGRYCHYKVVLTQMSLLWINNTRLEVFHNRSCIHSQQGEKPGLDRVANYLPLIWNIMAITDRHYTTAHRIQIRFPKIFSGQLE